MIQQDPEYIPEQVFNKYCQTDMKTNIQDYMQENWTEEEIKEMNEHPEQYQT